MTFDTFSGEAGRIPASILELDLDGCARRYAISPCVATLAMTNLVIQSEDFSTSWTTTELSVVTNITGVTPVGTDNADRLVPSAVSSANHRVVQSYATINGTHTISVYAKAEGYSVLQLKFFNATDSVWADVRFELTDGVCDIISGGVNITAFKMVQASGFPGWYRCSVTGLPPTLALSNQIHLYVKEAGMDTASVFTGDGTSGILCVGAQGRSGLAAGKYQVTTTADVDGMGQVDDLCFNTFGTCQDTANYLKEVRTMRFVDRSVAPVGLIDAFPAITNVRYGATKLQPGGGFSVRGQVTVTLQDFEHDDRGVDNYAEERTFDQESQGTFFGRFKARNLFYVGRPMKVLEGYLNEPFSLANFRTREYIIDNVVGPDERGRVTITGKDVMSLAIDKNALAPTPSTNTLRAAMTDVQTTLLPQTGEAVVMIAGDKHVRIGDEIIELTSESPTDTLNVVRARGGTTGEAHAIDDAVQECLTYEDFPVIDVIDDLLVNFANVDPSFIPTTDWEAEETETLTGYDLETIISEPTGVQTLLKEISEITLIDLWYSDVDSEIKLKLQTPFTAVTDTVTDESDIVLGTLMAKDVSARRLSRVLIYYGITNFARDLSDRENYKFVNFEIEADKELPNKFDNEKQRTILTRWMDSTNSVQVALTSQRLLDRFGNTPTEISFLLDAKDATRLQTGDVFDFTSRIIQGTDGLPITTRFQVVETAPKSPGSQYKYKAWAFFQDPTLDTLTISTNQINYNVFVELGGPPGAVDITLTINTGIDVDATNGNPSIETAGLHPDSTIRIVNNGDINGYGGDGKKGAGVLGRTINDPELGCLSNNQLTQIAQAGQSGGDAINIEIAEVTIDNTNGNIFAGAGGGGGGGGDITGTLVGSGGGGGGGLGKDTSVGGAGGTATTDAAGGCPVTANNGSAGTGGTDTLEGTGGLGGTAQAGDGGDGGTDWGEDGSAGQAADSSGGAGGAGGFAVRLNGASVIFEGGNNPSQVKGDVA